MASDCRLDLLIEECDDLYVKVRLREAARERRIPVLMETSDRGLLDIERFDKEPDRPLFHGVVGLINAADLKELSTKEKLPLVLKILDMSQVSATTKASMLEIEETLETWPQLGSAVMLGGAVITDTARRILLGHLQGSGRFYIDLETLVQLDLAARELGLRADIEPFPDRTLIFRARFRRDAAVADTPLFEQIRLRVTNRRLAQRQPLTVAEEAALQEVARSSGAELSFVTESSALGQVGEVIARCDRFIVLNQNVHSLTNRRRSLSNSSSAGTFDLDFSS